MRLVATAAAQLELEGTILDAEQVRKDLPAGSVVARDHTGHGLLGVHRLADAHRDLTAGAKPAPSRSVVHLDRHVAHAKQGAGLPDPGELQLGCATKAPQEDALERLALTLIPAFVDVEGKAPWRARFVVVVSIREHSAHPDQVDLAGLAGLDLPGKRSEADTVSRAPTLPPTDPPARTDRLAVTRLQVGTRDPPR